MNPQSPIPLARDLRINVSDRVGFPAELAGSSFIAAAVDPDRPVLVCLPGGTYTRGHFDEFMGSRSSSR